MASGHEVQLKLTSASDLKNVNWRNGALKPYAVVWVDPNNKSSTRVDEEGDTSPYWDETLTIHLPGPVDGDTTLHIDIVHAGSDPDTKPLIGSARLKLRDVIDDGGFDEPASRTLQLKRPSGRPQGKVDVKVTIREPRYRAPEPYNAPPYGVPPPAGSRDYTAPPTAYGAPYGVPAPPPPQNPYYAAPPPSGYPYNQYSAAPAPPYGQPAPYGQMGQGSYGRPGQGYGQGAYGQEEKKSKFGGMGTGLAVGAVAGAVGGVALAEGFDYVEDKIADDVAEKVEDDVYDGDDGDDF
ncbi:WW domain-containing protein C11B10.08 [Pyrus ussuriensis x Pyrus communis]|uniref:WW domain-containing protein C11B10.08 n=1 Tax=Pyrus ussuriensis x Pyrus communis TaxID=2448454 RepID=A0A5N5F6V2_9ROSA|nr:WW domain-containing protein C11B10.08 [Pyrus ussuriensis x Pyrus communis]